MPKAKRNKYTEGIGCAGGEAVVVGAACGVAAGFSDGISGKIDGKRGRDLGEWRREVLGFGG